MHRQYDNHKWTKTESEKSIKVDDTAFKWMAENLDIHYGTQEDEEELQR